MMQLTIEMIHDAFKAMKGVSIDDVIGIGYIVQRQVALGEGITDCMVLRLKEAKKYREYDTHDYDRDFVYIEAAYDGGFLDHFNHNKLWKLKAVPTTTIQQLVSPEVKALMEERGWKFWWGDPYYNAFEEVNDFFEDKPTGSYQGGITHDT